MAALYVLLGLIYTTTVFVMSYMDLISRRAFTSDMLWFYGGHVIMSLFLWASVLFIVSAMARAVPESPPESSPDRTAPEGEEPK